jgi:transposase-like protein
LFGKTTNDKQRFRCKYCSKTFIWKERYNKKSREQHWFKLWVTEGYSIRQLSKISGHSASKLERIKNYWLKQSPPKLSDYSIYKYIIYDGTYFHKNGCLICLMNAKGQAIISSIYAHKEGFNSVHPWFSSLRQRGLNPKFISMDGEKTVMNAVRSIWPKNKIQRCLYHIQHEGMRWLRTFPKTQAGRELRVILGTLCIIKSLKDRNRFVTTYKIWLNKYKDFVKSLPKTTVAFKDLKRTISLINNALPNMFHYLKDPNIPATTNSIESFYSRLKADYRRHRGLTQQNKIRYLQWYCYYQNINKT